MNSTLIILRERVNGQFNITVPLQFVRDNNLEAGDTLLLITNPEIKQAQIKSLNWVKEFITNGNHIHK